MKHALTLLPSAQVASMHSSQPKLRRESGGEGSLQQESSDVKARVRQQGFPLEPYLCQSRIVTNQMLNTRDFHMNSGNKW